jgi:hypothetical protein
VCAPAQVLGDPFAHFGGHIAFHVISKFSPYFLAGDAEEMLLSVHGFSRLLDSTLAER